MGALHAAQKILRGWLSCKGVLNIGDTTFHIVHATWVIPLRSASIYSHTSDQCMRKAAELSNAPLQQLSRVYPFQDFKLTKRVALLLRTEIDHWKPHMISK